MPYDKLDVMDPNTRMAQEDAWDVTAYFLSNDRPFNPRFTDLDWMATGPDGVPNRLKRNADAAYDWTMPRIDVNGNPSIDPADAPRFSREQHKYGPFQPITEALTQTRQWLGYP